MSALGIAINNGLPLVKVLGKILVTKHVVINKTSPGSSDWRYSNGFSFFKVLAVARQEHQRKHGGRETRNPSSSLPNERFIVEMQPLAVPYATQT